MLDDEHFTVDGTLIEAWASEKSYREKPGPPPSKGSGYGGEVLKRDTHESVTDPDARMYRKGLKTGWKLQHMAHAVSENQHGLVVATSVSACSPRAERQAAIAMVRQLKKTAAPRTVVADKGYHEQDFVEQLQQMNIAAHVPPYPVGLRRCWVDPGLYERPEYAAGQKKRKWIERFFSWLKTTAQLRKTRHRGHRKLNWNFTLAAEPTTSPAWLPSPPDVTSTHPRSEPTTQTTPASPPLCTPLGEKHPFFSTLYSPWAGLTSPVPLETAALTSTDGPDG